MGSHERIRQERVLHILRHAARVFCAQGYEGASMREISRASGVTLSSLYYYCRNKQDLLYQIQMTAFSEILARLAPRLAGVGDPARQLRALVRNHVEYSLEHPDEMKVLAHEDDSLAGRERKAVAEIKRRYYRKVMEIFEALEVRKRVRPFDPRVAVLSLFGMMNWIHTWHRSGADPGAEELAGAISTIFLEGVLERRLAARAPAEPAMAGRRAAGARHARQVPPMGVEAPARASS